MRPWGMPIEREVLPEPDDPLAVRPAAVVWAVLAGVAVVGWFLLAWLRLGHTVVEAAGESLGSAFALLLLVSVVGSLRKPDR